MNKIHVHQFDGRAIPLWRNFLCNYNNIGFLPVEDYFDKILKPYNAFYNYNYIDKGYIVFESEEDMIKFLLKYS